MYELSVAQAWLVMVIWSTSMNPSDIEPSHVVAAIATATVTAIRIIAETTGLKPFLFRSIFSSTPSCNLTIFFEDR